MGGSELSCSSDAVCWFEGWAIKRDGTLAFYGNAAPGRLGWCEWSNACVFPIAADARDFAAKCGLRARDYAVIGELWIDLRERPVIRFIPLMGVV